MAKNQTKLPHKKMATHFLGFGIIFTYLWPFHLIFGHFS